MLNSNIILLDVEIIGVELTRIINLKIFPTNVPIVLMSYLSILEICLLGYTINKVNYLLKPFPLNNLTSLLNWKLLKC